MSKILIIEDDKEINNLIKLYLEENSYTTESVFDGMKALKLLRERAEEFDLAILDIMLPFKSGDNVLSELRTHSNLPVIMLSAKDSVHTKVDMIRLGADDYMTKPFDLDELIVRIEAVLRRSIRDMDNAPNKSGKDVDDISGNQSEKKLTYRNIIMDINSKRVYIRGTNSLPDNAGEENDNQTENELELTAKEFEILELFLKNPTKLFSKANIYESVWNEEYLVEDTTLKVHMSNLRSKLKKYDDFDYIETVWGMGYRLKH
ncbi:MAG: response regulator transcription factor [Lachnospiraceae bacterium]|nr:response regulator transcription factor [Lachnospiraceae bacterium]